MPDLSWTKDLQAVGWLGLGMVILALGMFYRAKGSIKPTTNGNGGIKAIAESLALSTNKRFDDIESDVKGLRANCVGTHMGIERSLASLETNIRTLLENQRDIKDDIRALRDNK